MGYNSQHDTWPSSKIDPAVGVRRLLWFGDMYRQFLGYMLVAGMIHMCKDHDDLKELSHGWHFNGLKRSSSAWAIARPSGSISYSCRMLYDIIYICILYFIYTHCCRMIHIHSYTNIMICKKMHVYYLCIWIRHNMHKIHNIHNIHNIHKLLLIDFVQYVCVCFHQHHFWTGWAASASCARSSAGRVEASSAANTQQKWWFEMI